MAGNTGIQPSHYSLVKSYELILTLGRLKLVEQLLLRLHVSNLRLLQAA